MDVVKNVKKVIPMFLLVFVLNTSMFGAFNIIAPTIAKELSISSVTVSLLTMIGGLGLGIAGVVYAALSDYISIKKLMIVGIVVMNIGAILSFILSSINFYLLLVAVGLLFLGGSSAASVFVIFVSRYLPEEECPKYYGYTSACVGIGQALGFLIGGIFATYLQWNLVFLIPLLSVVAIPSILKYCPDDSLGKTKKLDILGLLMLTVFTISISLYFNMSAWQFLAGAVLMLIIFLVYISKGTDKLITIEFFKNKSFIIVILLSIIVFGIQMSFSFLMSFATQAIYGIQPSQVALVLLPSYLVVGVVGTRVGKIVSKIGSKNTLRYSLIGIISSMLVGALLIDKNIFVVPVLACLVSGFYALPYTTFLQATISTVAPKEIGTGIGFFSLMKSVGQSIVIVITGKLLMVDALRIAMPIVSAKASLYSNIILIFAAVLLLSLFIISIQIKNGSIKLN